MEEIKNTAEFEEIENPAEFEYKVSVIVPVYNVENYLRDCLDSLLAQTIDHNEMEVLLINDGSTDGSLAICEEYAELFSCFKLFSKENEGLSATRNYGIERAKGKYLIYLDSDDTYAPETLKEVTDFFDTVYDQVDLVTYKIQPYKNKEKLKLHYRYKYLTESGVYDLSKYPYICQTNIDICVKNLLENNFLFDTTPNFRHEDQEYISKILLDKQKIGYCSKGEYRYNKNNDDSFTASVFHAYYIFETSMKYFEDFVSQFEDEIPSYYQNMIIHDLSWKLSANILLPYHYSNEDFKNSVNRIKMLLNRIDDKVILENPSTDNFHRHYFLNLKYDAEIAAVISSKSDISIYKNGLQLYSAKKFEIILNKITVKGNQLQMLAFLKSPLFNYIAPPKIEAIAVKIDDTVEYIDLDFFLSSWSWYKTKEKTNNFFGFYFNCNADEIKSYKIQVIIDGIRYDTYYWFMPTAPYSNSIKQYTAILSNYQVEFNKNIFYITQLTEEETLNVRKEKTEKLKKIPSLYGIRAETDALYRKKVWLYYDCQGVAKDNGYYQFIHDVEKKDGIERFYVNANEEMPLGLFTKEQLCKVVAFGSLKHKILFCVSSKIITAYTEDRNINPFEKEENEYVADILNFEIVYLQHGILHAHLPWKYSPGRVNCDKVVISSYFEKENFTKTYNFPSKTLIESGMPRFDHIDRNAEPTNRILFAPSWRNYLIGASVGNKWTLTESKFLKSDYFTVFNSFLNSPELESVLAENDLYLDFKIHPIFAPYLHCFDNKNEHVNFADSFVRDEEYAAFITDFSSFVFDFAYLKRPIMYFVPDYIQFKSGMNQYRELDLPFEKAFGNLVTDTEGAIDELKRIIENDFMPENVFKERMDNFYMPLNDCSEKLYQYLIKEE